MKSNLDKVREKVIEAIPEIVEPRFGCRVLAYRTNPSERDTVATFLSFQQEEPHNAVLFFHKESCPFINSSFASKDYKIIGRDITLSDILRAIYNMLIIVDAHGNFYRMKMKLSDKIPKLGEYLGRWDLTTDLSHQSPETIDFLHSILCK